MRSKASKLAWEIAKRTGDTGMIRLAMRIDHPERYPEYDDTKTESKER